MGDEEVYAAFKAFASFGAGALSPQKTEMDGAHFAKLCRETGLQGGKLNSIAIDIIFSKVKPKVCHLTFTVVVPNSVGRRSRLFSSHSVLQLWSVLSPSS